MDILNHLPETSTPFLTIIKETASPVVIANENGEIIFWNKGSEDIFGYSESETLGKSIEILIPKRYHFAQIEAIKRFCELHKNTQNRITTTKIYGRAEEIYGIRKNGIEFPCEIVTVCYTEGVKKAFAAFIYDLSHGILGYLRNVSQKLETIDQRLNTLETKFAG